MTAELISRNESVPAFFEKYFQQDRIKSVIQVGANDGEMCDPLRPYLAREMKDLEAVLVEPIPFYIEKLKRLYEHRHSVSIINAACGSERGSMPIYFIPPEVADQMNGTGPANDWAHGQGSSDKETVLYWIEQNRFRGEEYNQRLEFFRNAVTSLDISVIRVADIPLSYAHENLLLVIDVQGFELEVLKGVRWSRPPAFIVFEDDMGKGSATCEYVISKGYHMASDSGVDKLFIRDL